MFHRRGRIWAIGALAALTVSAVGASTASADAGPRQADGSFPVTFRNDTDGRWKSSQIYITTIGQTTPGQWAYLRTDGTMAPIDHKMADAPGHLTKNGKNYPDMSFTLAEAGTVRIPERVEGGRIYISVGEPMYFAVSPDDKGWAGPDLHARSDPNYDVTFDWYEFTYAHGLIPFGGNTTQVDQFGLPLTARLQQTSSNSDFSSGITLSRAQVRSRFVDKVAKPFDGLVGPDRILAPRSAASFSAGGAYDSYLDPVIDRVWASWADGFNLKRGTDTFTGKVTGNTLSFSKNGVGGFNLRKPTSPDIFQCAGAISDGANDTDRELGAAVCAAFNRGVAGDTSDWYDSKTYYKGSRLDNDWSQFFHSINRDGLAYGFAYDDVNNQSSVTILPNSEPPTRLTIGVGW